MKTKILLLGALIALPAMADAPADIYAPSMHKMHQAMMAVKPTGDADADFVQDMIPHHQGAVDMAKVELQHGTDPALRQFAQHIIDTQGDEIKMMQDWQASHPQK